MKAPELHPVAVDVSARDDFSPGRADSMAFGVLLATVLATAALQCGGCAQAHEPELPPQGEAALRVAIAGDEAWRAAGLETTDTGCRLDELRILTRTPDQGLACPGSWACLGWLHQAPAAYISPELPAELVEHAALHELAHAMGYCYGRWPDGYDYEHADPAVWSPNPDSVERRAQQLLDAR